MSLPTLSTLSGTGGLQPGFCGNPSILPFPKSVTNPESFLYEIHLLEWDAEHLKLERDRSSRNEEERGNQ